MGESEKRSAFITSERLPVSIAIHLIAIGSVTFATVWDIDFPMASPAQYAQYSVAAAPPPWYSVSGTNIQPMVGVLSQVPS